MTFAMVDGVFTITSTTVMTTAFAAVLLLIGFWIKSKVNFLQKYCIPAPVVGGFLFMFITAIGHFTGAYNFEFNTSLQSIFMLAFFTTVGMSASLQLLKKGGILLVVYWLISGIVSIFQNALGIGIGKVIGLEAPYALLASAISMIGGHGAAASYGSTFAEMGYSAAVEVGAASATFGLIFAVLVGGPLARRLIEKNNLKPDENETIDTSVESVNASDGIKLSNLDIMKNVTSLLLCMAIGSMVSGWIGTLIGMSFPEYVGAMFIAMIVRNVNEKTHWYKFSFDLMDKTGDVMLNLYLSMALMSLKLWQLFDLLPGVLLIVVCQLVFLAAVAYFVVFRILGKNYDAAVMCAGLLGHGLGATPSAIVNMTSVKDRYGMSRKAFMIVPIVGAFLVDIIYQPQTIAFIKFFVAGFNG
ncbi:MAG: sodium/glutamate symporter [Oscillospiraceae bacterium]|nr:sodium/glutamate symporter [Oscillospiraceae bacterium]